MGVKQHRNIYSGHEGDCRRIPTQADMEAIRNLLKPDVYTATRMIIAFALFCIALCGSVDAKPREIARHPAYSPVPTANDPICFTHRSKSFKRTQERSITFPLISSLSRDTSLPSTPPTTLLLSRNAGAWTSVR